MPNKPAPAAAAGLPFCTCQEWLTDLARDRYKAERVIEALIEALDAMDGDPDLEPNLGHCFPHADDAEPDVDDEPRLGSPEIHHDQRRWGQGHGSRELDHDENGGLSAFGWERRLALEEARRATSANLRALNARRQRAVQRQGNRVLVHIGGHHV